MCRFWFRKYCWSNKQHRRENIALLVQILYQGLKSTLLNTFSEVSHRHHQASGLYNIANLTCNSYLGFIPSQIEIKSLNKGHAFKRNLGSKQRVDALKKASQKHCSKSSCHSLPQHQSNFGGKVNSHKKRGKPKKLKPNRRVNTVWASYKARCTECPFTLMFRWADKLSSLKYWFIFRAATCP